MFLKDVELVTGSTFVSLANLAATDVGAAGILPVPKNSAVPLLPAPNVIADVYNREPLLNITSPPSIDTVTFFSNRLPDV